MADDLSKHGPANAKRISLTEDHEVRYWTGTLGVFKDELAAAVKAVGHMAVDVRAYLKK